ncbi:hypothetical protein I4U23_017517 [Adineta vaga]|nr:hypothetical protein I4U23_017517 [Adineta vaga]
MQNEADAANKLYDKWQSLSPSLDHVNKFSYDTILSKYASSPWSGIQLFDAKGETELLKIDRSSTNDFISFSSLLKSGTIDANSIYYVNYGRQDDFAYLLNNGINFGASNKSIVFMRRQSSILSQTEQIHQAIYYGFDALVLFDDHENQQITTTNHRQSYFNEWRRFPDRKDRENYIDDILKTKDHFIRVLILSYNDVQRIFASLQPDSNQWSSCPSQWHQKSTSMKIGGTLSTIKLRLVVNMEDVQTQLPVVMSSIRGTIDAERFVMIGSELSSVQQNRIINEIIQAYTNRIKSGWKPKRSIVFCAWSSLNYDHYTIHRWIADNSRLIDRNLVAYVDLGNDIIGNSTLNLHGSSLLEQVAYRAANYVASPLPHSDTCYHRQMTTTTTTTSATAMMSHEQNHHHDHSRKRRDGNHEHQMKSNEQEENKCETYKLFDEWLRASRNRSPGIVQSIDSDSSASVFQLQYGIPSILIEMTDEQTLRNDTFYVRHEPIVSDHEMKADVFVAYTQFVTEIIRQLVDEPLIPFNLTNYAQQIDRLVVAFLDHHKRGYESVSSHIGDPSEFTKTMNEFTKSIRQVQSRINQVSKTDYMSLQSLNQELIEFERLFIGNDQLFGMSIPNKTSKHILFGPAFGLGNTVVPFPSLSNILYGIPGDPPTEFCDKSKVLWSKLREQILSMNRTINGFDGLLTEK